MRRGDLLPSHDAITRTAVTTASFSDLHLAAEAFRGDGSVTDELNRKPAGGHLRRTLRSTVLLPVDGDVVPDAALVGWTFQLEIRTVNGETKRAGFGPQIPDLTLTVVVFVWEIV